MAHIHEKIDFTATAFVVYDGKVLLRKHEKYNIWLGVGGHIELDEDPNTAVIREIKEEVGLDAELLTSKELPIFDTPKYRELVPPEFLNIHYTDEVHQHCDLTYFARSKTDKVIPERADDIWEWFSRESLKNNTYNIRKEVVFYAEKALELANQLNKRG